eukprot:CAMPEP_0204532658 /NCGR_PEP_ID=MMETSP0661-20131031/11844_1 /ASSEMBLY_ACC=CAM_ASM_000606 /TAXON_ID=109239 /ORGANISM="Alexandrium margalefi, Strain AMGDE01CS-322" /LENGTH=236 /DNA_ID=CAMNT_0051538919 /DNA_START=318 /DNA_END=1025 /DNA_ORIENTATION=-
MEAVPACLPVPPVERPADRGSSSVDVVERLAASVGEVLRCGLATPVVGCAVGGRGRAQAVARGVLPGPAQVRGRGAAVRVQAGVDAPLDLLPRAAVQVGRLREEVDRDRLAPEAVGEDVARVVVVAAVVPSQLPHVLPLRRLRLAARVQVGRRDRARGARHHGRAAVGDVLVLAAAAAAGAQAVTADVRVGDRGRDGRSAESHRNEHGRHPEERKNASQESGDEFVSSQNGWSQNG